MNAYIITIGNELLIGDIINSNASWIGKALTDIGVKVTRQSSVGDEAELIREELKMALLKADFVIITGGLGPTHDDVTKLALKDYFGVDFVLHEPTMHHIKQIFKKRGIPFSQSNYQQAEVPENCEVMFNKWGTAPGMWFKADHSFMAVLPGVPHEMKALMRDEVIPRIIKNGSVNHFYHAHYFKLAGIGESNLSDLVLMDAAMYLNERISLAFLPNTNGLTLRISSIGSSDEDAVKQIDPLTDYIRTKASEYLYSEDPEDDLSNAVGGLLRKYKATVATAESCTGGYIANWLTDVPGSSDYFMGTVVAYDNNIKMKQLGVSDNDLKEFGAVSSQVALQMASGAATLLGTDFALSTTGIAGPGGGTPDKPVGTVWIGFWSQNNHFAVKIQLTKDRIINKEQTAMIALDILRRQLAGIENLPYKLKAIYA